MNNWQDFVVLGLIAVAASYLAYLLWCRTTRRKGCDSCHGCPASSETKVVLDDPHIPTTLPPTRSTDVPDRHTTHRLG